MNLGLNVDFFFTSNIGTPTKAVFEHEKRQSAAYDVCFEKVLKEKERESKSERGERGGERERRVCERARAPATLSSR